MKNSVEKAAVAIPTDTRVELTLPGLLIGAATTVGLFVALAAGLQAIPETNSVLPDYETWFAGVAHDVVTRMQWVIGDITEPQFYKSWIASLGLIVGAFVGWSAWRRKKRWAGTPISYGTGLWPWILGAAGTSLILSNLIFGVRLTSDWQPTFVPFVCVATATVLIYGGGWKIMLTGAGFGVITTPLAMLIIATITGPLKLPAVIANTASMAIGTAFVLLLCRILPWMHLPEDTADPASNNDIPRTKLGRVAHDAVWTIRRIITDFTETQFYANEWATLGLLAGVALTAVLNPGFAALGSGLLAYILVAQALTSAVGIVVWHKVYRKDGFAPTYISVVSVAPAVVVTYGGSIATVVTGAVLGALLCPAVALPIARRLPKDIHPVVANTAAMAISTVIAVPLIGLFIQR